MEVQLAVFGFHLRDTLFLRLWPESVSRSRCFPFSLSASQQQHVFSIFPCMQHNRRLSQKHACSAAGALEFLNFMHAWSLFGAPLGGHWGRRSLRMSAFFHGGAQSLRRPAISGSGVLRKCRALETVARFHHGGSAQTA